MKTHISVTLEMKNPNFTKWSSFFQAMCGKFSLHPHIDGPALPLTTDPSRDIAECTVLGWILNTINEFVLDLGITKENQSARKLWVVIKGLFYSNRAPRLSICLRSFTP